MKKVVVLAFLSFCSSLLTAQNQAVIDSLLHITESRSSDKEKVDAFVQVAAQYMKVDSGKTASYAETAVELSKKINYVEGGINATYKVARMYLYTGYIDEAIVIYEDGMALSKEQSYASGEALGLIGLGSAKMYQGNLEEGVVLAKEALAKGQTSSDFNITARAHNLLGSIYFKLGDFDEALVNQSKFLELSRELGDKQLMGVAYRAVGMIQRFQDESDRAIKSLQLSLEMMEEVKDTEGIAAVIINMGGIQYDLGQYNNALENFLAFLDIMIETGNKRGEKIAYTNIASSYLVQEEYEKALEYYFKSLAIEREIGDRLGESLVLNNIGFLYDYKGESERSLEYYTQALTIRKEVGDQYGIAETSRNLGTAYHNLGRNRQALDFYLEALRIFENIQSDSDIAYALIGMGFACEGLGRLNEAKGYLDRAVGLAQSLGHLEVIKQATEQLALVEEALGNYKRAYEVNKLFHEAKDSLLNEEETKRFARIEADYEFQKEKDSIQFENEKSLLAKNNEIARSNLFFYLALTIGCTLLVIGFVVARTRVRSKALQAKNLEEMSAFKEAMTGMIAHDLKNPLGVIMGTESEKPSTRNMARQMLSLVNNMLDVQKFEQAEVKLKLESVQVGQLVVEAVEQVRTLMDEKNIQINYDLAEGIVVLGDQEMLLRVMINLLTNAIKYSPSNGHITISVLARGQMVEFEVADQGPGIQEDQLETVFGAYQQLDPKKSGQVGSTGLGLTFCKLALEAHGSDIGVNSKVGRGTTFSFTLKIALGHESDSETLEEKVLTLSKADRDLILDLIPTLKMYGLHQAMQMETLLEQVSDKSEATKKWVEAVLNAAYTGNEDHFNDLVESVEKE